MRVSIILLLIVFLFASPLPAEDHRYPIDDFHHRSIELPIDYDDPGAGTFFQYYELSSNFDFERPTLFFFQDIAQRYGKPGEVDDLAKRYHFFKDFNVVYYQIRGRQYSYIELRNPDGSVDWEKAYRLLSSDLVIEDIELIRRDLFMEDPDTKILVFGRSGGGFLIQKYLIRYSEFVQRAFIRAAPNPIIMKQLGNPEAKYFYNTLTEVDPELYPKLETVLEKELVPDYKLFWILRSIPYASENAGEEIKLLIEDLYSGSLELYEQYLQKKGFDFSMMITDEEDLSQWEIGMYFCPMEVSPEIMVDPDPEYFEPFYETMKKLCEPYVKLIREDRVEAPVFPPLEKFREVETEVFYLAGRHDHVSDYRIGIELEKYFKNYELYIAEDNHTMSIHKECYPALRNAFFKYGLGSKELKDVRESSGCKEWKLEDHSGVRIEVIPEKVYIEKTEYSQFLNFDFLLKNLTGQKIAVVEILIHAYDDKGKLVRRKMVDTNGFNPGINTIGTTSLEAGDSVYIYNPFYRFDPDFKIGKIKYDFQFNSEEYGLSGSDITVEPVYYETKTDLRLPLRDMAIVYDGHDFYSHHRRVDLTHPMLKQIGITDNPGRYGYDFCVVNEKGEMFESDGKSNEDWFGYGAEIYSPAAGRVIELFNDMPDNILGEKVFDYGQVLENPRSMAGNYIIIDHRNGEYSMLGHFKEGSITVREGDKIKQGQLLGQMGFSGSTGDWVHLHYELRDGTEMWSSEGLPSYFRDYNKILGSKTVKVKNGYIDTGAIVEPQS